MTTLREAATQALGALEGGADSWQLVGPAIDALKEALVEDAMQKFTDVNQELEAALAEPDWQDLYLKEKKRADMWREKYESVAGAEQRIHPLAEPVQEPGDFDHGIGGDRFKVVRGAFWWHVLIGDSPTKHGKFHSRASAEKMAADLLREFRNGAFVQHEAALAEPVQEPVLNPAPGYCKHCKQYTIEEPLPAEPVQEQPVCDECGKHKRDGWALYCVKCVEPMFAPPQRPAESVQEPQCNPHPKAPHGFLRNASHNADRYVCECDGWEPYEAGYQAGMEAALRAQL